MTEARVRRINIRAAVDVEDRLRGCSTKKLYVDVDSLDPCERESSSSPLFHTDHVWTFGGRVKICHTRASLSHEEFVRRVKICGVGDAEKPGVRRRMKNNIWGFEEGVFVESLAPGVARLIPVPEGHKLQNFQTGKSGFIERNKDGATFELTHTIPPQIPFAVSTSISRSSKVEKLKAFVARPSRRLVHERLVHLPKHRGRCRCLGCLLGKSVRKRFKKARNAKYKQSKSLRQLDADFVGPISPESIRRMRYGLLIIDPKSNMVFPFPIRHKSDNTGRLRTLLLKIRSKYGTSLGDKVLYYVRTDNEREWDGAFMSFLNNNQILPLRPAPYAPAANGKVERLVRQVVEGLRAMLLHTDQRLWCYAMEHWGLVWNDVHTNKGTGLTPNEEAERDLLKPDDPRRRSGRNAPGNGAGSWSSRTTTINKITPRRSALKILIGARTTVFLTTR